MNAVIKPHIVTHVKKSDIYIENYQQENLKRLHQNNLQLMKISL